MVNWGGGPAQACPRSRSNSVNHGSDVSNLLPPAIRSNSITRSSSPRSSSWPTTPGFAAQRRVHRVRRAGADQREVGLVGRGRAGEISALLHQQFFRADRGGEPVAEPLARVDLVELDVAERVARHCLARRLHRRDDLRHARAFGDEQVHPVLLVHDRRSRFASPAMSIGRSGR